MFEKILVANRGEIACRVTRTARRLGADAIHPGYGFLSENPAFVEATEDAGITFIGPDRRAMVAMGDKISAKTIARKAKISVLPGVDKAISDAGDALRVAREVGFPVMIKAVAGGGGRGMRVVRSERELGGAYDSAVSESLPGFADGRVFIEKFVERPRHVEVQILADNQGHTIHLWERECSIQRRHQKVIEETPSPLLADETRTEMTAQAVLLARAVNYRSAGTVEFILDQSGHFYFLEMNTRLQVEHPITEMITGIDLVEQMIRIAAGEPLSLRQSDIRREGCAIEARICAEDPRRNFLPSVGRVVRYRPPATNRAVRLDGGLVEGSEVSVHYDSLIAKLCVHENTRDAAVRTMQAALDRFILRGPEHNIAFLASLVRHSLFTAGRLSTELIADAFPEDFRGTPLEGTILDNLLAGACCVHLRESARAARISG